jgi:hypothetical protein
MRNVAILPVVVLSLVAASAAPAAADGVKPSVTVEVSDAHTSGPDNDTAYWANNSMTGQCGQTDGGFVIAAQSFLWAWGKYAGPVDNFWGSASKNALMAYQRERGNLQVDGCAGPLTWRDMQGQTRALGTSSNCDGAPGTLAVSGLARGGRTAYYDRSSSTKYWYTDTHVTPNGGPVRAHLYRFSDDLVVRC